MVMEEVCDNAIDDDNDGLIDINDPDCTCETISLESIIPNPSFEDQNCCPSNHSQMNCAEGWIQPSIGTSDYMHHCGYEYEAVQYTSLNEFPDGEGAIGFLAGRDPDGKMHLEYIGTCLNQPILKGTTYVLKFHVGFLDEMFSPPIRLAVYGTPSCDNLPFTEIEADCPLAYPDWFIIGLEEIDSDGAFNVWREFSMTIRPNMDINAIVIGADCVFGSSEEGIGYLLDNLILNDEDDFDFERVDQIHPCNSEFAFAVAENPNFSYQWYKAGIALLGETDAQLSQIYGEGTYQLRIINKLTQECRISDEFYFEIPIIINEIFETICEGDNLLYNGDIIEEAGIYEYTLTSVNGCDSIVKLNVEKQTPQIDTLRIQKLQGETYSIGNSNFRNEGEYHINLATADNCDSTVVLYLENIKVFIPNVFSPNGDSINDYFEVLTSGDDLLTKEMSIFDRWGNLLYLGDKWDGRFKNELVNSGVYFYLIKLINNDGQELIFSNSFTLTR